MGIVNLIRNLS